MTTPPDSTWYSDDADLDDTTYAEPDPDRGRDAWIEDRLMYGTL